MEEITRFDEEEVELGISPLGMLLVILLGVIALVFFLDPNSSLYDIRIGGMIALSMVIAFAPRGLQRWTNEGDLPKVLLLALIGAALVSIMVTVVYTIPFQSTLTTSTIIVLALPPIFEELIFRVGVFLAVREVAGTIIAVVTQAGLFALYHFIVWSPDLQYAFVLFFGGIVFQMIFLQSKNILSSMIAHAIVNLRPYLLVILLSPFALLAVGGAIFIVLWRRFRE